MLPANLFNRQKIWCSTNKIDFHDPGELILAKPAMLKLKIGHLPLKFTCIYIYIYIAILTGSFSWEVLKLYNLQWNRRKSSKLWNEIKNIGMNNIWDSISVLWSSSEDSQTVYSEQYQKLLLALTSKCAIDVNGVRYKDPKRLKSNVGVRDTATVVETRTFWVSSDWENETKKSTCLV